MGIDFFRFAIVRTTMRHDRHAEIIADFREETTFLHVYFKKEFLVQYKRDTLYGVNDFICKKMRSIARFKGQVKN